jgi:hypothetical protein
VQLTRYCEISDTMSSIPGPRTILIGPIFFVTPQQSSNIAPCMKPCMKPCMQQSPTTVKDEGFKSCLHDERCMCTAKKPYLVAFLTLSTPSPRKLFLLVTFHANRTLFLIRARPIYALNRGGCGTALRRHGSRRWKV